MQLWNSVRSILTLQMIMIVKYSFIYSPDLNYFWSLISHEKLELKMHLSRAKSGNRKPSFHAHREKSWNLMGLLEWASGLSLGFPSPFFIRNPELVCCIDFVDGDESWWFGRDAGHAGLLKFRGLAWVGRAWHCQWAKKNEELVKHINNNLNISLGAVLGYKWIHIYIYITIVIGLMSQLMRIITIVLSINPNGTSQVVMEYSWIQLLLGCQPSWMSLDYSYPNDIPMISQCTLISEVKPSVNPFHCLVHLPMSRL